LVRNNYKSLSGQRRPIFGLSCCWAFCGCAS